MKLYHVSFDTECPNCYFRPRIPESTAAGEDRKTPRICLSDSVEHCLQAMAADARAHLKTGCNIVVYSVDSEDIPSSCLIPPEELTRKKLVPDAIENQEYWALTDLHMQRDLLCVRDFSYEHTLAFSCMDSSGVRAVIKSVLPEFPLPDTDSTEQVYRAAMGYAHEHRLYGAEDEIWDSLAELPFAQKTAFSGLVLVPVLQEEELER